jgi:hypothetical protein
MATQLIPLHAITGLIACRWGKEEENQELAKIPWKVGVSRPTSGVAAPGTLTVRSPVTGGRTQKRPQANDTAHQLWDCSPECHADAVATSG